MNRELKDVLAFMASLKVVTHEDFAGLRNALKRLLVLGNEEKDITKALGYVVKVLPVEDIVTKKLASILLIRFAASIPDVSFLIQNTLRRDFRDPNPLVRCLALKTICACSSQPEDVDEFLRTGLKDGSAYVRRAAVLGCLALNCKSSEILLGHGYVDLLYEMLRDPDPLVVTNSLAALDEILAGEGGVVVNRNIAHHLLSRLPDFSDWCLARVLPFLGKYEPRDEEETFAILNVLDQLFQSQNCGVVVQVAKLFLNRLGALPNLQSGVFVRMCPRLAFFLNSSTNAELVYLILAFVQDNLDGAPGRFGPLYKSLFCKYREPAHVKVKKIEILAELTDGENASEVLDEIGMHCTYSSGAVSHAAIEAIGRIARRHPGVFELFARKLLQLLALERANVTSHILFILQDLDLHKLNDKSELAVKLQNCYDILESADGKCAFLWLLGEYGEYLPDSPYLLERFLNDWPKCDASVKHGILASALKLFFKRPAECQMNLGRIFEVSHGDSNEELRDQTRFYYALLLQDRELLQNILQGTDNDKSSVCCTNQNNS